MIYNTITNTNPDPNFPRNFVSSFSSSFDLKVNDKFISLDSTGCKIEKRKRKKTLNSSQRKSFGLFSIPKEMQKFNLYLEIHELWKEYISDLLKGIENDLLISNKLVKAELVGCFITIVESKNPTIVGISGILIRESLNMFYLLSKLDKLYKIAKTNTIFTIVIGKN